ncbi:single-stranded DNA-binding protein [Acinetobacter soli]|nr:single-stranded DNA-binding protein [Acinetobacter soli]PPB87201.1 single-stranded DNA-binding protein [Acinetobacter soli]
MPNVNKVILMGVLGRDPETKQFPNGGSVTTFSVATTEFWKDKTIGEPKEANSINLYQQSFKECCQRS